MGTYLQTSAFQFAIRIDSIRFTWRIDSVSQKIGPFNSTTTWSLYAIFNNSLYILDAR